MLVVEDNAMNRLVARRTLEAWGVAVEEACDGAEGIAAVAEGGPFDLVLMDLQMPGVDGLEATRHIRQTLGVPSDDLPILALTASVLAQCKTRDKFKKLMTELYDYPRFSCPSKQGER